MTLEDFNLVQERVKKFSSKINDKELKLSEIRNKYPYIFNSWRGIRFTEKGKKAGCCEEWHNFETFFHDVIGNYEEGKVFRRKDTTKPFSKENFVWLTPKEAAQYKNNIIYLEYNGEKHTLEEWSILTNQTIGAITNRYHKHKHNFTTKEIIFGKEKKRKDKQVKDWKESPMLIRRKASKMISSYKHKDKQLGFEPSDIDITWFIENIMSKPCVYCGDTERIGADRIDNNKPHSIDNIVPCCYDCNCARNNNFTHEEMFEIGKTIAEVKSKRPKKEITQIHSNDEYLNYQKRNYNPTIYQYDDDMNFLEKFNSIFDILKKYPDINKKSLLSACRGQKHNSHSYHGFKWFYQKQDNELPLRL